MEHIYISRIGDGNIILELKKSLEEESLEELVESYNNQVRIGIVGAHRQGLHLLAMRKEFMERLGESPVYVEENVLISLTGKIRLENGKIKHVD
tara:strand:- start:15664 stop:15945 length:282 start_codon:yes stop_codon:yes gene_type:complete